MDILEADEHAGDVPDMACAVCAQLLFPASSGGEIVAWLHRPELGLVLDQDDGFPDDVPGRVEAVRRRRNLDVVDHMAIPVEADQVHVERLCDFCAGQRPRWLVPVLPFEPQDNYRVVGGFAACDVCARLVKKNRWDDVVRRALANAGQKFGSVAYDPRSVMHHKAWMAQVREYQVGPPERILDGVGQGASGRPRG